VGVWAGGGGDGSNEGGVRVVGGVRAHGTAGGGDTGENTGGNLR